MKTMQREEVWKIIVGVITDLLAEQGQEPGEMTATTQLNAELGIGSVEAIHTLIMLEDKLQTPLDFSELAIREGEYVQDLQLGQLHDFVCKTLGLPLAAAEQH